MAGIRANAEQFTQRWQDRMKGSTTRIQEGIERVTESPTAKAAKSLDKAKNGYIRAIDSGKMGRALNKVSLEQWKTATKEKSIQRIAQGVDGAAPKVLAFAQKLITFETELQKKVNSMSDVTLEDRITRMTAWVRGMATFDPTK